MKDPCWDFEGTEGFEAHRGELAAFALDQHPKVRIDVGVTPFGHHRDVDTFKALAETVCDGAYIGGTMLPKGASIGRSSISTDDTPDSTSMSTIH